MDSNYVGMLTDFGIAKEKYKDDFLKQLCGSRNYLSPEMLARKEYKEGWHLGAGAVIYELCTLVPLITDALQWEEEHNVTNNLPNPATANLVPVTLESIGPLCPKPSSSRIEAAKDARNPIYVQEFITSISLACRSSKDTTPYSQDLHHTLRLMLQVNPQNRASASLLLATPVVAAIRRYLSETTNIVLDYLKECTCDDAVLQYKVIRRLYRNRTGTHVIVKSTLVAHSFGQRRYAWRMIQATQLLPQRTSIFYIRKVWNILQ